MKKYIINTIYILSIFTLISCGNSKNPENEKEAIETNENLIEITEAQFQSSAMELGEILEQNFSEGIKTNGFIEISILLKRITDKNSIINELHSTP